MSLLIIRVFGAALVALALAAQARKAPGPQRRRAFALGAAAFALIALGNLLSALAVAPFLAGVPTIVGMATMFGSLLTLFFAYRAGEFDAQMQRAREMVSDERRKQDEAARARETRK